MHIQAQKLNPLESVTLSAEETAILGWIRSAPWEVVKDAKPPLPYKAKVPEFYKGARLYRMQAGGASNASLGSLELFIKKLGIQGVISKQGLYPVSGHGNQPRYLTLAKVDLDNLGVGNEPEDDE